MPTHGNGALGSLDYTPAERKELAAKWVKFLASIITSIFTAFIANNLWDLGWCELLTKFKNF